MTPTKSQNPTGNISQDKVDTLAQILCMRIEEVISELGLRLYKSGNKLVGPCPIHGGRKSSSFNLWPEGHSVPCFWKCRSHHCEEIFKPTVIGFIRGVLSHQQFGWEKKGDKLLSFPEALQWCCNFVGETIDNIKVDKAELERRRFAAQVHSLTKGKEAKPDGVPRNLVRNSLIIPADFFVRKGYSPDILAKYDVGLCDKQGKEMFNRVVVPIYDDSKSLMIGCTGRSIYNECPQCGSYHANGTPCPSEEQRWLFSKWKHSKNFNMGSCFYNYWNAKKVIQETGIAVIVEGPGDVWKLEEAGIHNAIALFGCEMTEEQQVLLETSGAMSIVLLLDNDEPGRAGVKNIKEALNRFYNIYTPEYKGKDIGDLKVESVTSDLVPIIKSIGLKSKVYSL